MRVFRPSRDQPKAVTAAMELGLNKLGLTDGATKAMSMPAPPHIGVYFRGDALALEARK
jgi:hypothetical protein